jgi:predicted RND superfamily exporter protein
VESVRLDDGRTIRSSGSGVVFAAMLRAIVHDGPVVTAVAFLGVAVVLLTLSGWRRDTLAVLAALLVGVLWMAGAAALAGVRVNFLNFIALPITFGIGVDYGINLLQRKRHEGPGGLHKTVVATGGAVTLCSLTTIIGYAALLCADNHALRSFGAMAILGEISCLAVSISLLPAFFAAREGSAAHRLPAPDSQSTPHKAV